MTYVLPNGTPIDIDMLEFAMQNADMEAYLHLQTGKVIFLAELSHSEREDIADSDDYVPVEHSDSQEEYQWMEQFVAEIVALQDAQIAEKLSIALMGKGAFRRFKDVLHMQGETWTQAWYSWKDEQLSTALEKWLMSLPVKITATDGNC